MWTRAKLIRRRTASENTNIGLIVTSLNEAELGLDIGDEEIPE